MDYSFEGLSVREFVFDFEDHGIALSFDGYYDLVVSKAFTPFSYICSKYRL